MIKNLTPNKTLSYVCVVWCQKDHRGQLLRQIGWIALIIFLSLFEISNSQNQSPGPESTQVLQLHYPDGHVRRLFTFFYFY